MSATALRSTALGESGALTLRGRDALLLPVFGKEAEVAFKRTMRLEANFGSVPNLTGVISDLDVCSASSNDGKTKIELGMLPSNELSAQSRLSHVCLNGFIIY